MKVLNEYANSHHYWDELEKTNWHCAHCGQQEVWESVGGGDYYVGNESICTSCGWACYYLGGPKEIKDLNKLGMLEQLRTGEASTPTTERGG